MSDGQKRVTCTDPTFVRLHVYAAAIIPLLPAFTRLIRQAESISSVSLHINVHYTRAIASSEIPDLPEGITLTPGRPELGDMLSASIGCASVLKNTTKEGVHGVVVGVCGPEELMNRVRQVEHEVGAKVRAAVGGVELVEEYVLRSIVHSLFVYELILSAPVPYRAFAW